MTAPGRSLRVALVVLLLAACDDRSASQEPQPIPSPAGAGSRQAGDELRENGRLNGFLRDEIIALARAGITEPVKGWRTVHLSSGVYLVVADTGSGDAAFVAEKFYPDDGADPYWRLRSAARMTARDWRLIRLQRPMPEAETDEPDEQQPAEPAEPRFTR